MASHNTAVLRAAACVHNLLEAALSVQNNFVDVAGHVHWSLSDMVAYEPGMPAVVKAQHVCLKAGSLKRNTALEYSTRVVRGGGPSM